MRGGGSGGKYKEQKVHRGGKYEESTPRNLKNYAELILVVLYPQCLLIKSIGTLLLEKIKGKKNNLCVDCGQFYIY
jgi:hypothetical protein